jgi:DNA-binding CsgD family transcriptional regulator
MGKRTPTRRDLVLHMAAGKSAAAFARKFGRSERTIRYQASRPAVRREVEAILREQARQTSAILTGLGAKAAAELAKLATRSGDEKVRLQACRTILQQIVDMSTFSDLESRLAELEADRAAPHKRLPPRSQPACDIDNERPLYRPRPRQLSEGTPRR